MSEPTGGVKVTGLNELMLHLKNFHRDLYDVLEEQVGRSLQRTIRAASSKYPKGAWTMRVGHAKWPAGEVSTAGGKSRSVASWADAPAGVKASIFDTMGRRSGGKTPQARATIASLTERYGKPQRFLWPAWLSIRDETMREIDASMRDIERKIERAGA